MSLFVLPFPAIDPIAIELGPFAIRWYALSYVAGILFAWWYMLRLVSNARLWGGTSPLEKRDVDDLILWITLGVVLGGRLGYVLFYNPAYFIAHPAEILQVWAGGMSFHGGFLGVVLAVLVFAWWRGRPVSAMADISAAATPIGLMLGRIANFINGELWGRPADVPWAMVFPLAGPEPRHPSQLYQALMEGLILFLVLRILTHRFESLNRPWLTTGTFLAGYGIARIIGEQFRMPDAHIGFLWGGLTMGMLLSLPMVLIGLAIIAFALMRPKRTA
ncbi:prolipoprotein diacylglyceryl transferase [Microbaculum marinisediminis]|uniref:Phosphatidylglycerol--prolipoprotein diacylglyceryl transferase n=1 Tax=Microbaculum marinisediminis TaxID=2931392 RepID=A0AAW5QV58_9HYPH|nr:prolipoprotein diacylglyceryl transferase [Microbaculum sp. A6E488]MCT8971951.1 prolipoprotein diacylglyceryl transferase [Microbaculum sp. A6E488]